MANIHAVQTLFLAKQVVPYAVGHGFSTVLSEHHSVYDYVYPSVGAFPPNFTQSLFTKLFYLQSFYYTVCNGQAY